MDWLKELNAAMDYIEQNLEGEIKPGQLARITHCSPYHFQRMFSYMCNIPLGEYIRRRKMTRAAYDLQNTGAKIIDIALTYGYESPTAFNRAFQSVHGVAPSTARNEGTKLSAFQPMSFAITIKGETEMKYRIEKKDAFRIVGVCKNSTMNAEQNFKEIPLFWQEAGQKGIIPEICKLINQSPFGLLGVSTSIDSNTFDYYIAASTDRPAPAGMAEYEVGPYTWAIFESVGPMPQALQDMQRRIVSEWLPSSGYEYADGPDIEIYPDGNQSAADYTVEIWLPVVKKA